jgi:hypothetical protein
MPTMGELYAKNPALAAETALRNGSLQGAYLIIAARMPGLDAGMATDQAAANRGCLAPPPVLG